MQQAEHFSEQGQALHSVSYLVVVALRYEEGQP